MYSKTTQRAPGLGTPCSTPYWIWIHLFLTPSHVSKDSSNSLFISLSASISVFVVCPAGPLLLLENIKFFELKNEGYRDGIKRKETR